MASNSLQPRYSLPGSFVYGILQECWSGLPGPPPGDPPRPGIPTHFRVSCGSWIEGGFFTTEPPRKLNYHSTCWEFPFLNSIENVCFFTAAAAAKSRQSCLTLCDPIEGSPTGSPLLGILQARILEWVSIPFSNEWKWKVKVKSLSRVRLLVTPWTIA